MRSSIIRKLSLIYLFTIICLVLFGLAAVQNIERLRESTVAEAHNQALISQLQTLLVDLLDAETSARGYVASGREEFLASYRAALAVVPAALASLTREITTPAQRARLAALQETTDQEIDALRLVADSPLAVTPAATAVDLLRSSKSAMERARSLIDDMTAAERGTLEHDQAAALTGQRLMLEGLVGSGLIVVALSLIVGASVLRDLRWRLAVLADGARRLGEGELAHRVAIAGRDEISGLARAFNRMAGRLQDSNAALDAFAYTVSHDLRAPLRAMQGFSKALLEDFADQLGATGRDYASRVVAAAARMDELIQDLLAYSRLSRTDMALGPVPLEETVDTILHRMQGVIGERKAAVTVERPLPVVRAHRATLQQCLINLVNNALKFTAPGTAPEIRIRAEKHDGRVRCWIEDRGIGVAPEHHERIFRVFERLHGSETYPGTGIGLAIVKKGAERMDGQVGVESAAGHGSRFWFELREGNAAA
ncbi:MAG: CHASE3 domain-containing protein [Alphaproteobacteria bacterium]|nr:CHASE3 domain-containing protein [Alphaproteobacteria bacterium]